MLASRLFKIILPGRFYFISLLLCSGFGLAWAETTPNPPTTTHIQDKSILGELEGLDKQVNESQSELEQIKQNIQQQQDNIADLEAQIGSKRAEISIQKHLLAAHIRLLYGLGDQGVLKIIFSQESLANIQQGFLYFSHLLEHRQIHFQKFKSQLKKLQELSTAKLQLQENLKTLAEKLETEQTVQTESQVTRSDLVTQVKQEKGLLDRKAEELNLAQTELSGFVAGLSKEVTHNNDPAPTSFGNINKEKGKLPTPVNALAISRPPGLFFKTKTAEAVRAIFQGQVVYANWFKGYGLLLILNHGDRVYSLYGHNSRLLVAAGDWVAKGNKIAETGDTGSIDGVTGVYFEIRSKGKSDPPNQWLKISKRG
ncbi:MAG: peptidoglycan DD-metalloendopeptidase family protein [Magnetococcus sp. DMHC-6]